MTASQELHSKIVEHLAASPKNVVVLQTTYRVTIYKPKHAELFRPSQRKTDTGVYVQHGKRAEYVFPEYLRLASYR